MSSPFEATSPSLCPLISTLHCVAPVTLDVEFVARKEAAEQAYIAGDGERSGVHRRVVRDRLCVSLAQCGVA